MHLVMYLLTRQVRVSQLPLLEDFMHLVTYLLTRQVRVTVAVGDSGPSRCAHVTCSKPELAPFVC